MAEIISLANQKGGVGKTTTAINLAWALACLDQEVLVVDIDPQSNATSGLGVSLGEGDKNVYDLLSGRARAHEAVKQTANEWLDVLPASHDLAGAEVELVGLDGREMVLKNALAPLDEMYKFIFIDCPPSLGLLTVNALAASDSVITPIQCEYYAMEGLAYFTETVSKIKSFINPALTVDGGILTMYDSRINLSNQVREEVAKYYGARIYKTPVPRNVRLAEAPSFGQTIFAYDPASRGAQAYFELAMEFLVRRGANPKQFEGLKSYIGGEDEDFDFGG
ncbi:MAG: AAA family ATPase [Elusimicrobiales bacterium]|nr:AAA family ATPase [Elusimicrobiales bacterium]